MTPPEPAQSSSKPSELVAPPASVSAVPASVFAAIGVTLLAWASAFIVIRGTAPLFSGGALALGRLAVGSVVLGVVVLIGRRWVAPTLREWMFLAGYGVGWFGAYNVALNLAEKTLDAGTTAMIINIAPILIALGAGVILREGIPKWLGIGAAVAFVGAILIGIGTGARGFDDISGVLWCLVGAVTYAAGVLFQKPLLTRLPNAQVTWLGCVLGMVACLPFLGDLASGIRTAPPAGVWGIVYLGVVPTALAFSLWTFALSRMPAGQLGVSTYIVPPLVIVLGLIVFGESPTVIAVIGGAVCLVGVALSRRRSRVPELPESLAE